MSGQRFKEARQKLGLKQTELGEKINIPAYRIRDIENEKQNITTEIAKKMEDIFFINGWWLLTGKGEMTETKNKEILEEKEKEIIESYRKLPEERQKYYYHKIIAESLDD